MFTFAIHMHSSSPYQLKRLNILKHDQYGPKAADEAVTLENTKANLKDLLKQRSSKQDLIGRNILRPEDGSFMPHSPYRVMWYYLIVEVKKSPKK